MGSLPSKRCLGKDANSLKTEIATLGCFDNFTVIVLLSVTIAILEMVFYSYQ